MLLGSQSPQLPPKRGTPPDDPQPNIVKERLAIIKWAYKLRLLGKDVQSFFLIDVQSFHMIYQKFLRPFVL